MFNETAKIFNPEYPLMNEGIRTHATPQSCPNPIDNCRLAVISREMLKDKTIDLAELDKPIVFVLKGMK